MFGPFLLQLIWLALLMLLQAFVFNHIHIGGHATPLPYVYFLLILPPDTPRAALLVWGFVIGLVADTFTNTPGAAAAAMTLVAFLRPGLLSLFAPNDKEENAYVSSAALMRWGAFTGYALCAVLIHEVVFFVLEAFTFVHWEKLLIDIGSSSVLTMFVIMAFESIRKSRMEQTEKKN